MLALILNLAGTWTEWFDQYLNYPGLEIWKFINLIIFLTAGIVILRRPLTQAFETRSAAIKQELLKARTERDEAQALLEEAEQKLSTIDVDVRQVKEQAEREAAEEKQRLLDAAAEEIRKLELQAQRETEMAEKVAFKELREFLAERSVELATVGIKAQMRPEDDARIIEKSVTELRRSGV
jgi:F-type H+-transporting ATPase subunit b